jgi:hypothetical protein
VNEILRRILLVLTVALVMVAALMLMAVPAFAAHAGGEGGGEFCTHTLTTPAQQNAQVPASQNFTCLLV